MAAFSTCIEGNLLHSYLPRLVAFRVFCRIALKYSAFDVHHISLLFFRDMISSKKK